MLDNRCPTNMNDNDKATRPRPVSESISEMTEIVLPNDANPLNALLGGRLMHWIDLAGAMAAHRHSRTYVVTASIDHMDFLVPVRVGDFVILRSSVNRVYHTSMEVGVKVWVENYLSEERRHVSSAYLTFVAIDAAGNRVAVPPVVPETEDEKRRYEDAARRREIRRKESARRNEVRS
ncbi:MAG: acyl-CoA thioesterase [Terriglobales bacterium]